MNLELFIARKIHFGNSKEKKISSPAIKIATAGIALGLTAMILAVCIVVGFKKEIRNKVIGFGTHIQIANFDNNTSYETQPICINDTVINKLKSINGVRHIETYATKPGIIKTESDFQAIVLKGVDKNYDWEFFRHNLVEGTIINKQDTSTTNEAIVSKYIADRLHLKVGDAFVSYFMQEPIKARKFTIVGIYSTNFEDYDKLFVITDIDIIRSISAWEEDQVSGIEILVNDYDQLDEVKSEVFYEMVAHKDRMGNTFYTRSIKEINPMIFNWLDLLDMNVWVIIILMLAVSGFTMISGLLILILERTNMIGILKAMGAKNSMIRKTFMYVSSFIIIKGMLWGNLIALVICLVQKMTGFISLDPSIYYVSAMPVDINIIYILLINVGCLATSLLMMVGPSYLIARISPAKSIKFE